MNVLQFDGPQVSDNGKPTVAAVMHRRALVRQGGFSAALVKMLQGWQEYAKCHQESYETPIGNDGVLGDPWGEIGLQIKRLLNGETGGLDCGSLAHNITALIQEHGLKTDGYQLEQ